MSLLDAFTYKRKRALVVGGATGMGAAIAAVVRDAGGEVVVMDLAKVSAMPGVKSIRLDLSDKASIDAAVNDCGGPVHALFACAGVADGTPGIERINFIGHRHLIDRMVGREMLPRGSAIGFISSAAGIGWQGNLPLLQKFLDIKDFDGATRWAQEHGKADYMWSKQAINAYVAREALRLLKQGIRINATMPGPTDTPLAQANKAQWLAFGTDYRNEAGIKVSTPIEQAYPLVFLCSDAAIGVTGITMVTDAGYVAAGITGSFPAATPVVGFLSGAGRSAAEAATTPTVHPETRMLIDGKLVAAESGATFENVNPATEKVLGSVADGSAADMQRAIRAARRAFDKTDWSTNRALRARCLEQLQAGLEAEREELREQLILEVGCPRMSTHGPQLDGPLKDAIRYPAKLIEKFPWETVLSDGADHMGTPNARRIWKEPVGVVGAIVPWNFPFEVTINKVAQALATGNTVVLKPAPNTPWNATLLGRVIAERTDIPAGVVNVVTCSDPLVGEELTLSPLVDLISFTGSTVVGKRIMEKGAATLKRVFLELGGKSATIVLDDADFNTALLTGLAVCFHAGQGCAIPTRMLLPRSRYQEGVEKLKGMMARAPYGDPQRPDVMMGPVISEKQRDRVLGYIKKGVAEGATLAVGGGRPADLPKGWYVEPTMFVDVDNSMSIAQEEIFGPVLAVIRFEDDDDAVRIANDSQYGLAGGVFSASLDRANGVARRIRAGMMSVNGGAPYGADMPFGGYKFSGIGRQNGTAGFEQYLETKSVAWPTA
jgi:aldehyde dehydrogenase (NAD+)